MPHHPSRVNHNLFFYKENTNMSSGKFPEVYEHTVIVLNFVLVGLIDLNPFSSGGYISSTIQMHIGISIFEKKKSGLLYTRKNAVNPFQTNFVEYFDAITTFRN